MTIGFLLNTCEPFYRGGYERRAWSFARELARQGHDVRIYTSCPRPEIIEGVRFVPLARPRRFFNARGVRNGTADILFALGIFRLLWRVRRGELQALDVCATPFLHLPPVAFVAWVKRIPVTLTCHEALLAELPAYVLERGERVSWRAALKVRILALIYCAGMGLFPRRLAVSRRTEAALAGEGFPAFAMVEYGLEAEAFRAQEPTPAAEGGPAGLVYCGRLTPIKSVGVTLEALGGLRGTRPFHFHIVGEGSERARLERQAGETGGAARVTFHGEVSEEEKRAVMGAGEIFVHGSPREGFSIATLEAMAQGCAALVVSDPVRPNGVLDFVRDGREGLVVAPGTGALREGLRRLIEDAPLRHACRISAWRTAAEYRVERQAARLLRVLVSPAER